MLRRSQVTVQQLMIVAGVVVLASAVYFISRGLVSTTQVSLDVEQAKSFEIISESLEGRGEVEASPALWADTRFDYKSSVTLKNRHSRAIQDVVVFTGDYVGEGVKKGTVSVRYLDQSTGKYVDVPLAEFSNSDGCEYTDIDGIAFTVDLKADEEKTYEIYGSSEYTENDSCTELRHDNIYAYTQNTGQTKAKIQGKYGFFYVGEGSVSGKGNVAIGQGSCDLDTNNFCRLKEAKIPTLVDLEGEANIEEAGNLVFVEGQVFEDDMALYFWVSGCRESFRIRLENLDPFDKVFTIRDGKGFAAESSTETYREQKLDADGILEDVLEITNPGVWSIDLPQGVKMTSEDVYINFALDPDALSRVVDEDGKLRMDFEWEYDEYGNMQTQCLSMTRFEEAKKRPDVSAPRFNKSFADHLFPAFYPKKPDSNDKVKIFVLAWDSNDNVDPNVSGSIRNCSAKIGSSVLPMLAVDYPGTGENPVQVANASFDTNTEVAVVALGTMKPGEHTVGVSCEDLYRNINTTQIVFEITGSLEDTSSPEFRILDKVLNKKIRTQPAKKTNVVNLSFTVDVYDSANPIKNCWLSVYNDAEVLYREVEMTPVSGNYGEDLEIVAEFTTPKPLALGQYSSEVVCEDTQGHFGSVLETLGVGDGVAPWIQRVEFILPDTRVGGKILPMFLEPWTKVGFEVAASDDIEVKGCSVLYQTDPLRKLTDHEPRDLVCKAGCGTSSSVFGFENSEWPRGGDYKIRFVCEDTSGNLVEEDVLLSVVDATSPIVEDFSLSPGKPGNQDVLTFSANVSDDVAVTTCNLTLHDSGGVEKAHLVVVAGDPEMVPKSEGDYSNVSVVLSVNKLADDEYGVNFTCDDESTDNIPNVLRRDFYVDTYGPEYSNLQLEQDSNRVSVNAFDSLSGVSNCSLALASESGTITQDMVEDSGGLFSSVLLLPPAFELTLACLDNYGRESYYAYQSLEIPEVVFPKVEQGGQYNNNESLVFGVEPEVASSGGPEIVVEECLCSLTHGSGVLFADKVMEPGTVFSYNYSNQDGKSNSIGAQVSCRDSTGFSYTQTGSTNVLDVVPPKISNVSISPIASLRTDNRTLFFKVSVSDKGEGVKKCEAVIDPRGDPLEDVFKYPMVPQGSYGSGVRYENYGGHNYDAFGTPFPPEPLSVVSAGQYSLNSGPFYGGNYTVRVTCWDNAGLVAGSGNQDNIGEGNKTYFGIKDTTPPVFYAMAEGSQSVEVWMSNTTQWADTDSVTFRVVAVDEATDVECFINMTDDATGYPGWLWTKLSRESATNRFFLAKKEPGPLCIGTGHEFKLENLPPELAEVLGSHQIDSMEVYNVPEDIEHYTLSLEYKTGEGCSNPSNCAKYGSCGCAVFPSRSGVRYLRSDLGCLYQNRLEVWQDSSSLGTYYTCEREYTNYWFDLNASTLALSKSSTSPQGGSPLVKEIHAFVDPAYRKVSVSCKDNVGVSGQKNNATVSRDIIIKRTSQQIMDIGVSSHYTQSESTITSTDTLTIGTETLTITSSPNWFTVQITVSNSTLFEQDCYLTVEGQHVSTASITHIGTLEASEDGPYMVLKQFHGAALGGGEEGNYTVSVKCSPDACGSTYGRGYPSTWVMVDNTPPNIRPGTVHLESKDNPVGPDSVYVSVQGLNVRDDVGSGIDYCILSGVFSGGEYGLDSCDFDLQTRYVWPPPSQEDLGFIDLSSGSGTFISPPYVRGDITVAAFLLTCVDKSGNVKVVPSDQFLSCCSEINPWSEASMILTDILTGMPLSLFGHEGVGNPALFAAGVGAAAGGFLIGILVLTSVISSTGIGAFAAIGLLIAAAIMMIIASDCAAETTVQYPM